MMFAGLSTVIIDEIHALAGTKRGDQLALCLARLAALAPASRRVGLSATVAHRQPLLDFVGTGAPARLIEVPEAAPPHIRMMLPEERIAWSGRMGLASASAVLKRITASGMTIVFRQHARAGRIAVPGIMEAERSQPCRSRCITAAWIWPSAAAWKRRWRAAICARWLRHPRWIWASIGAAWTR